MIAMSRQKHSFVFFTLYLPPIGNDYINHTMLENDRKMTYNHAVIYFFHSISKSNAVINYIDIDLM